ncbi:MAG: hypothetical protein Q4C42_02620 [Clostridia bacterium]|nr:hypothetical protein [Clostridia bacterium]
MLSFKNKFKIAWGIGIAEILLIILAIIFEGVLLIAAVLGLIVYIIFTMRFCYCEDCKRNLPLTIVTLSLKKGIRCPYCREPLTFKKYFAPNPFRPR